MRAGIIAPSQIMYIAQATNNSEAGIKEMLAEIVKILIKNNLEIVITPDKNSPLEFMGKEYLRLKGKKLYEVLPLEDKELGYKEWVNTDLGEAINCGTWRNQPEKTNDVTDFLICVGYGVGAIIEIGYSKWFRKKPVFIINELVSGKLPIEVNQSLDLRYISIKELDKEIKNLK
jgi:hypothetical protein